MSSGNRNLDLDIRGMRPWEKIRDLPAERDFAAGTAEPEPPARRQRVDVEDLRVRATEALARVEGIPFNVAASRITSRDPTELRTFLYELQPRQTNREE